MLQNNREKSPRRRRVGNLEHLERRELLSTTSLQKYGAELGHVNLRIAELSKVSASAPNAQKVQGCAVALGNQHDTLKSAIHAVQVRRINCADAAAFSGRGEAKPRKGDDAR